MAKNYIYSTLTTGMTYTSYKQGGADLPVVEHRVHVAGGANVADKHLLTPRGVVTEVSDEDLEHLERNQLFQRHKANGFILVDTIKVDPEIKVAADMEQKDDSAPLTPEDYPDSAEGAKPSASNKRAGRLSKGE